jgi:hypothetical protein
METQKVNTYRARVKELDHLGCNEDGSAFSKDLCCASMP